MFNVFKHIIKQAELRGHIRSVNFSELSARICSNHFDLPSVIKSTLIFSVRIYEKRNADEIKRTYLYEHPFDTPCEIKLKLYNAVVAP